MFVFPFRFPRISWNVGAESKYSEVVKIALWQQVRSSKHSKKRSAFHPSGPISGFLWWKFLCEREQVAKRIGETPPSDSEEKWTPPSEKERWLLLCLLSGRGYQTVQKQKALGPGLRLEL